MKAYSYIKNFDEHINNYYVNKKDECENFFLIKKEINNKSKQNTIKTIINKKTFLQDSRVTIDKLIFASLNNDLDYNLLFMCNKRLNSISYLCYVFLKSNNLLSVKDINNNIYQYVIEFIEKLNNEIERDFYDFLIIIKSYLKGDNNE